ncbi:RpiB/LacA/LacB family sugar-phosphate isomerase [Actinotalea sp. M2MS4P-6]|uniref:RpiB/LacA/LacB family sugar-phosphate isomerase n=1 Tax=Actinotalea sp. M2MS4P-6 TaxID=2983762 RepID=UPI0021E417F9|nr:RpiB/LacA/LacB family sugar-phosphate isomerase [Actinotalea sp. M2MS4P-6]MCV2395657.1 RpiB/LacA/LacB family sugar-phosphate isomerase [Actinotalea sp. M2MS4P-6]
MIIGFGSDPNASDLRAALMGHAVALGHHVVDLGSDDPVYAHTAVRVAEEVVAGRLDRGVLLCGTGIGMSIAANKVDGAYCALVADSYQARRAQLSNNANLIAVGALVTGPELAKVLLEEYLSHEFDPGSRSAVKVDAIRSYESRATA